MSAARRPWAADLLHFWFHELTPAQWFGGGDRVDRLCARRFAARWQALHRRAPAEFLSDPQTALAAILLFDQIPRNVFRGDPRAFASDRLARTLTRGAVARGWHRTVPAPARQFVLMPLMHSEAMADQLLSLRLFARLGRPGNLAFARAHARMIARFGRFPHRNAVLGRRSSAAEVAAVTQGNAW